MNVDSFASNPPLKWYFISSVPFMALLIAITVVLRKISFSNMENRIQRFFRTNYGMEKNDLPPEEDLEDEKV